MQEIFLFIFLFSHFKSIREEREENVKTFTATQYYYLNIYQIKCKIRRSHMLKMSESFQVLEQVNIQSHLY